MRAGEISKTSPVHGVTCLLVLMSLLCFGYLNTAGKMTEYGTRREDPVIAGVLHPAWDIGWPKRYAVMEPNFYGPSWRWMFAPNQKIAAFFWRELAVNVSVIIIMISVVAVAVESWVRRFAFTLRLWHLMAILAWLGCGLCMLLSMAQYREPHYDVLWDEYGQSEIARLFLYDDGGMLDAIAGWFIYTLIGVFFFGLPEFVRACMRRLMWTQIIKQQRTQVVSQSEHVRQ